MGELDSLQVICCIILMSGWNQGGLLPSPQGYRTVFRSVARVKIIEPATWAQACLLKVTHLVLYSTVFHKLLPGSKASQECTFVWGRGLPNYCCWRGYKRTSYLAILLILLFFLFFLSSDFSLSSLVYFQCFLPEIFWVFYFSNHVP